MATETTPSSARVDRAVAPTAEEAKAANAGEYAPRGGNRFLYDLSRNWAVRLGLVGAAGVAAYQNVPAIQEFVDSKLFHAGESASNPDVFDQTQDYIAVSSRNTIGIPVEEIGKSSQNIQASNLEDLTPFSNPENPGVTYYRSDKPIIEIPFPFEVPENANITIRRSESRMGFSSTSGVKDTIAINGLPKDTVIYAPMDGKFSFGQTVNLVGTSTQASLIMIDDKDNRISIYFQFGVSDSLIDEAVAPKNPVGQYTWAQDGIDVKAGQPLFTVDSKEAPGNNWIADQLMMTGSVSLVNPDNPNLRKIVYSPLVIQTEENKAVSVKT